MRRQPKNAPEMLILFLLLIPIGAYYLIKWIIKGIAAICAWACNRKKMNNSPSLIGVQGYEHRSGNAIPIVDMATVDLMDGIEFENFIASLLKLSGIKKVDLTPASGDYGVDIVTKDGGEKSVFQCKCYGQNLGIKPVQEVFAGKMHYGAEKAFVVTNFYFTQNAKALARATGVELWDREVLIRLIKAAKKKNSYKDETRKTGNSNLNIMEEPMPMLKHSVASYTNYGGDEMATILKAGRYRFGKNIPNGMYDLIAISGGGWLTIYDKEDDENMLWLGDGYDGNGAKEYRGLDSDVVKVFTLEGNVEVTITKTQMIVIEGE